MSFKNLEERFNAKVNDLYAAAQNKYDGGRKSDGANDDPLITRRVADGYWQFSESRSTPVLSAALDAQRLTLFTASPRGIQFLAKQKLLQTGNAFEYTRLLNPGFVIGNAAPFLHVRRHLRPFSLRPGEGVFGVTDASDFTPWNLLPIAQLQEETYNSFEVGAKGPGSFLRKIPVIGTKISAALASRSVGEKLISKEGRDAAWKKSRPELVALSDSTIVSSVSSSVLRATSRGSQIRSLRKIFDPEISHMVNADRKINERENLSGGIAKIHQGIVDNFIKDLTKDVILTSKPDRQQPFLKYFTAEQGAITSRATIQDGENAATLGNAQARLGKRIKYIKDPANTEAPDPSQNILERYNKLRTRLETNRFEDAILVSFAMGNNDPVQFRSFIRDLTQSATPEYKTYQYIGRIERFVYYITVEREINFKLDLLAFSKDELKLVWERLNYLTGMVFPYGITRGILQPNIVKLTIGNVYHDQPGYITSFNVNFNEVSESWDLDNEVPIGATVDMSFKLIEKATKTANSPFYGITGDIRVPGPPPEIQEPSEPELVALDDVQLNLDTQELSRQIVPTTPPPAFPPPPIR